MKDPPTSAQRTAVIEDLANHICRRDDLRLLAVDGIDGAGKSTFADELVAVIRTAGRPTVRSTTDSFHNPRAVRWRRGNLSPEGFYLDSHDLVRLKQYLLDPIVAVPPRPFRAAAFDEPTDTDVNAPLQDPAPGLIVVFDGLFLQRPELADYWDFVVYLDGEERVAQDRIERGISLCNASPEPLIQLLQFWAVLQRYAGGFQLYKEECRPAENAHAIVDNNDFLAPTLTLQEPRRRHTAAT